MTVSIPQAVSTVATYVKYDGKEYEYSYVSIPQAVSTVATGEWDDNLIPTLKSFNTASGKHCCNTIQLVNVYSICTSRFQYRKR